MAHKGTEETDRNFLDGRPKRNTPLGKVRCTWTDNIKTIKFILQEYNERIWKELRSLQVRPMVEFCKHGNESLAFRGLLNNII
jgi:hypothetical protein